MESVSHAPLTLFGTADTVTATVTLQAGASDVLSVFMTIVQEAAVAKLATCWLMESARLHSDFDDT